MNDEIRSALEQIETYALRLAVHAVENFQAGHDPQDFFQRAQRLLDSCEMIRHTLPDDSWSAEQRVSRLSRKFTSLLTTNMAKDGQQRRHRR